MAKCFEWGLRPIGATQTLPVTMCQNLCIIFWVSDALVGGAV